VSPSTTGVPLPDGGSMSVARWVADGPQVLAVHGISSTSRLWLWLHQAAPEMSIIAPDLRGRGDSPAAPGQSSVQRHADDLVAVLDAMGIEQIDVVGMSMGGFVAMALAATHPDRVRSLTLVDGGIPLARDARVPADPDAARALLADRYARQDRTWPSAREYGDFFVSQTAPLLDRDDPLIDEYVAHDLTQGPGGGQVRLALDAVGDDALDVFVNDSAAVALAGLTVPTRLIYAQWGAGPDSPPMYDTAYVDQVVATTPALQSAELMTGVDHAAIIMSSRGAEASAQVLRRSLAPRP
jgi:pimeloyl-ACP methyl ester carboxylesterase